MVLSSARCRFAYFTWFSPRPGRLLTSPVVARNQSGLGAEASGRCTILLCLVMSMIAKSIQLIRGKVYCLFHDWIYLIRRIYSAKTASTSVACCPSISCFSTQRTTGAVFDLVLFLNVFLISETSYAAGEEE